MRIKYIHTIGDSTLDNLYWMLGDDLDIEKAKKASVEGRLAEFMEGKGFKVISHAYDGFTTRSVLEGDRIGSVLPLNLAKMVYMREKTAEGTRWEVKPLEDLQAKIFENPEATHYVVISVGGNDFRENLSHPFRLIKDISDIQKRHSQIMDRVKSLKGRDVRPILVTQYRPDNNNDPYRIYRLFSAIGAVAVAAQSGCAGLIAAPFFAAAGICSKPTAVLALMTGALGLYFCRRIVPMPINRQVLKEKTVGMAALEAMMKTFYQPILETARKEGVPILDLSTTFNPRHPLYTCGIEPNENGSRLIAEGISHIIKYHNFKGNSQIYSNEDGSGYRSRPA